MIRQVLYAAFITIVVVRPLGAMQQDLSDARIIIVVDSLDRAAFANVAELLQARVPGLHIARTGDGGLRWFMRGPASVAESTPMVLIDDVRINVAGSAMRDLGTRPPLLDEIDVEDVERIEILSGAATATRYGTGSGNGVLRIVTFAPRAQPMSFRIATSATMLEENVDYPTNANRSGIDTAGAPVRRCTLQMEANEDCTPTGPLTLLNVLDSDSPFETGIGARVSASLVSGTDRVAWKGAATLDHQSSTTGTLADQRFHLRGAAALRPTRDARITLRGHWTRGNDDLPSPYERSVLSQGLLARADTTWSGFVVPHVSPYHSARYGGSVHGDWQPRGWLDLRLTSGMARLTDENDLELTVAGGISPARDIDLRSERRRRDTDVRLDVEARYAAGPLRKTALTVEHVVSKQEDESSETQQLTSGPTLARAFWINQRTAIARVGLTQRLRLGQSLEVNGGVGLDQVRVNDVRWDVPVSPHVSLHYDARRFLPLRLRAALGDVANVPQTTRLFFFFPPAPIEPERPRAEVTREREVGFDATTMGERLGLSFTWYTKRTNNVGVLVEAPQPSPSPVQFTRIEVLNRGIEASVHARILETSRLAWQARAWYAYNHNEVTSRGGGPAFLGETAVFNPQFLSQPQWVREGDPLGAYLLRPVIAVRDLDGDGLIDDACAETFPSCEALFELSSDFRPAYPPTSASMETSVRFGSLTVSAMLDHRSGHVVNNATMQARCVRECPALYDPSTPLHDQAEAILAPGSVGSISDASFTKLRELSLRWDAPSSWARALGGSRLTVSLAGRNIATWTDYNGLDPETTSAPWVPLASFDDMAVPLPRRFTFRAQLQGR